MIKPVILCGGSGTRLWPLSRKDTPKQFNTFFNDSTLFELTAKRLGLINKDLIVVSGQGHEFTIAESIKKLGLKSQIILENEGRNTAPAMALAAFLSSENNPGDDNLLLFAPADHYIKDTQSFIDSVNIATDYAKDGAIVTFGIKPSFPSSAYGYIKKGQKISKNSYKVDSFTEKPDQTSARDMLNKGNFLWNAGIFLCKESVLIKALKEHANDIFDVTNKSFKNKISKQFDEFTIINKLDYKIFSKCRSESIDYAVMEKHEKIITVSIDCDWTDVGSWNSLANIGNKDKSNNVIVGNAILYDTKNTYVNALQRPVITLGTEDLIVVDTVDALLIANKDSAEDVKKVVDDLKNKNFTQVNTHREVFRPWGKYDSVDSGDGFQVKRITVKPKQKLSVQMHFHRSEHWVVVSGIGRVHYGDKSRDLNVNESTYHDKEVVHALENPGDEPLILIEVQVGNYLGEDDIVRYEDIYGRTDS